MRSFKELTGGLQRSLARGLADYRCYVARANAQAAAQARTAREADFLASWLPLLSEMLWVALGETKDITHIIVPDSPEGLFGTHKILHTTSSGIMPLRFAAWKSPGFSVTAREIQYAVSTEIHRLCRLQGVPLVDVQVQIRDHGRVFFALHFRRPKIEL